MYAIAFQGSVIELPVGPESIDMSYPARVTIVPTLDSHYVDHFGSGIASISISGTTGWGAGRNANGKLLLERMIALYLTYLEAAKRAANPATVRMTFADGFTGRTYQTVPDASGLRVSQHRSSPMLRRYNIVLAVVDGAGLKRGLSENVPNPSTPRSVVGASMSRIPSLARPNLAYTVQVGDTIGGIANRYGANETDVRLANGIVPGTVQTGAVVRVTLPTRVGGGGGNNR